MTKKDDNEIKKTTKKVLKEAKQEPKKNVKEQKVNKEETIVKKESNNLVSLFELIAIIIFIIIVLAFFPGTPIWNIVVLLLILTVLVFVHEGGHFIAAKKCGAYVYEFAIGMGPKVLGFKRKNDPTEYTIRAFPIGGYCQIAGEEGEDDESLSKDQFMCNKSKLQRTIILVAGVTMNFILAIVLLFAISLIFGSTDQSNVIGQVTPNSPAEKAGVVVGDKIIEYNGYKINNWDKISLAASMKENNYTYIIEHKDGTQDKYEIKPAEYVQLKDELIEVTKDHTLEEIIKEHDLDKDTKTTKLVGIGASKEVKHGFKNAISYAFTKFKSIFTTMFIIVWSLITGKIGLNSLSGPVGMYSIVGTVATYGIANIIYLAAYLSINLGVINILPFPAFDGGRVLFVVIEAITGKKVDSKIEGWFHTIGFFLLMILMLYITFQDVINLF